MMEIDIIGPDVAYEHACFQIFKRTNFGVGFIFPRYDMLATAQKELQFNINAICKDSVYRLQKSNIALHNGSTISLITKAQGSRAFRGMRFDMFFIMYEDLEHEMKMELFPSLCTQPDSKLYTVYEYSRW